MSFFLTLVVYRVPDFFLYFLYKESPTQNQILFLYQKFGCPVLRDIKIISIYMFLL